MKKIKTALFALAALLLCAALAGCGAMHSDKGSEMSPGYWAGWDGSEVSGNTYDEITENPFTEVSADNKTSQTSLTVNTAAYTELRRLIKENYKINKNAVRIEEMVNYFTYDYPEPAEGETFAFSAAAIPAPWNPDNRLLTIGIKAKEIDSSDYTNNLVFLIDVSGSMSGRDRIELAKKAFINLTDTLTENDKVSIVTYASGVTTVLQPTPGSNKTAIKAAISGLRAGGATSGGAAIVTAYDLIKDDVDYYDNSRIIIASDGDFNVGASTPEALTELISGYRRSGVYVSALGFGMGNLNNSMMTEIADSGQGGYAYIDSIEEADRVLIEGKNGALYNVAEEAMARLTFNENAVKKYRLIGFENRTLTDEEWENPETPAGAIGSGQTVTAIYELELHADSDADIAELTVQYYNPKEAADPETRETRSMTVTQSHLSPLGSAAGNIMSRSDALFISAVVETGLILRNSPYCGSASYVNVIARLEGLQLNDNAKTEFLELVQVLNDRNNER